MGQAGSGRVSAYPQGNWWGWVWSCGAVELKPLVPGPDSKQTVCALCWPGQRGLRRLVVHLGPLVCLGFWDGLLILAARWI